MGWWWVIGRQPDAGGTQRRLPWWRAWQRSSQNRGRRCRGPPGRRWRQGWGRRQGRLLLPWAGPAWWAAASDPAVATAASSHLLCHRITTACATAISAPTDATAASSHLPRHFSPRLLAPKLASAIFPSLLWIISRIIHFHNSLHVKGSLFHRFHQYPYHPPPSHRRRLSSRCHYRSSPRSSIPLQCA